MRKIELYLYNVGNDFMRLMDKIKGVFGKKAVKKDKIFEYEEFKERYVSKSLKENRDYLQQIFTPYQPIWLRCYADHKRDYSSSGRILWIYHPYIYHALF